MSLFKSSSRIKYVGGGRGLCLPEVGFIREVTAFLVGASAGDSTGSGATVGARVGATGGGRGLAGLGFAGDGFRTAEGFPTEIRHGGIVC